MFHAVIFDAVSCVKETCWKPYLSDRNWKQSDYDGDNDGNGACNTDDETEAAVCGCLQQYIQHYTNVCFALFCSNSFSTVNLNFNTVNIVV